MITPEAQTLKDGTVRWKVRFREDRVARSRTFTTERGAAQFARLIRDVGVADAVRILDERAADAAVDMPTLEDWCTARVELLTGIEEGTRRLYLGYIRNDLGAIGGLPLDAIGDTEIARWVKGLNGAGSTIAKKHGFVSGMLERAVGKHIAANPCRGTRLPQTTRQPMTFLTHDEHAEFLRYFTPYWRPLVRTLFSTGLRWGEITALQVRDLDLRGASLHVVRAWKKGRVLGPPKSPKSRRTIGLAPETVAELRHLVKGREPGDWVFVNHRGGPVLHSTFYDDVWAPAVRLANGEPAQAPGGKRVTKRRDAKGREILPAKKKRRLGKRPRIHDARHTCASWLLGAGVPPNVVQAHLGHESITTTVDRYGHVLPDARDAVAAALSAALNSAA